MTKHGDFVKDISFTVENLEGVIAHCKYVGDAVCKDIWVESDKNGSVKMAKLQTYGDCTHTLVENIDYTGEYLPGYMSSKNTGGRPWKMYVPKNLERLPRPNLLFIDHCVGNQPEDDMNKVADWYVKNLQFHRFWSVDDSQMHTKYSALRSVVMASWDEYIKLPINEPADGLKVSQIQEYVNFHGGAGVQHIAITTEDILY